MKFRHFILTPFAILILSLLFSFTVSAGDKAANIFSLLFSQVNGDTAVGADFNPEESVDVILQATDSGGGLMPTQVLFLNKDGSLMTRWLPGLSIFDDSIVQYYDHGKWTGRKLLYTNDFSIPDDFSVSNQESAFRPEDLEGYTGGSRYVWEWQAADPDFPVYSFWADLGNAFIGTVRQTVGYLDDQPFLLFGFDEYGGLNEIRYGTGLEKKLLPDTEEQEENGLRITTSKYYKGDFPGTVLAQVTKTYNSDGLLIDYQYDAPDFELGISSSFIHRTFEYNSDGIPVHIHLETDHQEYDGLYNNAGQMTVLQDVQKNTCYLYFLSEDGIVTDLLVDQIGAVEKYGLLEEGPGWTAVEEFLELAASKGADCRDLILIHVDRENNSYNAKTVSDPQTETVVSLIPGLPSLQTIMYQYEKNVVSQKTIVHRIFDDYCMLTQTSREVQSFDSDGNVTGSETKDTFITVTEDSESGVRIYKLEGSRNAAVLRTATAGDAVFTFGLDNLFPSVLYELNDFVTPDE